MAYVKLSDKYKKICKKCDIDKQCQKTEWVECKRFGEVRHLWYLNCPKSTEIKKKTGVW